MNLSTAQLAGIVTLFMILSGLVIVENIDKIYICVPEDNVKECLRLSESGITCYTITGGDRCVGGKWERLSKYLSKTTSESVTKYLCPFGGECVRI